MAERYQSIRGLTTTSVAVLAPGMNVPFAKRQSVPLGHRRGRLLSRPTSVLSFDRGEPMTLVGTLWGQFAEPTIAGRTHENADTLLKLKQGAAGGFRTRPDQL
jgi:hypothetical protein